MASPVSPRRRSPGGQHRYEFIAPDPGTYFYHPHSGLQLDRALYGVLVVDDPHDTGGYDHEWIVVLDDWIDGTGRTPEDVLTALTAMSGHGDMPEMDHGGGGDTPGSGDGAMDGMGPGDMSGHGDMAGMETMTSPLLGGAGDVAYPHYLINGRVPAAPVTFRQAGTAGADPGGQRRLRHGVPGGAGWASDDRDAHWRFPGRPDDGRRARARDGRAGRCHSGTR